MMHKTCSESQYSFDLHVYQTKPNQTKPSLPLPISPEMKKCLVKLASCLCQKNIKC